MNTIMLARGQIKPTSQEIKDAPKIPAQSVKHVVIIRRMSWVPKEKANDNENDRRCQCMSGDYPGCLAINLPVQTAREADKKQEEKRSKEHCSDECLSNE
jgi:hypothetical protein